MQDADMGEEFSIEEVEKELAYVSDLVAFTDTFKGFVINTLEECDLILQKYKEYDESGYGMMIKIEECKDGLELNV